MADVTDLTAVQSTIQPNTRLVWAETPSNPMLKISDIAHNAGALMGVDGI